MLRLPSFHAEPPETRFPLSGRSAVFILDALASGRPAIGPAAPRGLASPLAAALASDPLLLWWTLLACCDQGATLDPLPTTESLAGWLQGHPEYWGQVDFIAVEPDQREAWSQAAGESLLVAELAAQLASPDDQPAVSMLAHLAIAQEHVSAWTTAPWPWSWTQLTARHTKLAHHVNLIRDALAGRRDWPASLPQKDKQLRRRRRELAAQWRSVCGPESFKQIVTRLQSPADATPSSGEYGERLEQEKLAALAEFAAGAGHEINNPIATIAGRAQLLLRHESHPERRRDLATIHRQAMRVHEMIADLMLFARPPDLNPQWFDLGGLLDELAAGLQPQCEQQEAELRIAPPGAPLWIRADRTQIAVAIRSLCDNSLEATGPQATIEVRSQFTAGPAPEPADQTDAADRPPHALRAPHFNHLALASQAAGSAGDFEAGWLQIEVVDDGPGISAEVRRHLFDPFFSGREAGRGLGVGLSKCWRIVTMHGGTIEVESLAPRGCRFVVRLPVAATESPVLQSPA